MPASQRLNWLEARLISALGEAPAARTLVLGAPGWAGHLPGQHVDVRLTAEDGYSAQRSYSIAAPAAADHVELTVQRVPDGEVSPYLVETMMIGDELELRGPIGGWFAWRWQDTEPVLLIAGGSGVVPLMAMIRERARVRSPVPFRLVYSVRGPADVLYAAELRRRADAGDGLAVDLLYTRSAPGGDRRGPVRISAADLPRDGWASAARPRIYVCGPTGFVETASQLLVQAGYPPMSIRTERFGPTGG